MPDRLLLGVECDFCRRFIRFFVVILRGDFMSVKDMFLALCVVFIWGVNFVVIKVGLHEMPPFLLAGLRFLLVAFPAIFFIGLPKIPIRWLFAYGLTISFGQFSFLFLAIKLGMPAGIASLVIQSQAFFTIFFGVLLLSERCKWNHIAGVLVACIGMYLLAGASMKTQGNNSINLGTLLLTLGAAVSWALGNIANKIILRNNQVSGIALVVWSSLVTVVPFFVCSWVFEGGAQVRESLLGISAKTVGSLIYLSFFATILCYAAWGYLLGRYETWRIAPLSLLVPVVGIASAKLLLDEMLSGEQVLGAFIVVLGLLLNTFGSRFSLARWVRG